MTTKIIKSDIYIGEEIIMEINNAETKIIILNKIPKWCSKNSVPKILRHVLNEQSKF